MIICFGLLKLFSFMRKFFLSRLLFFVFLWQGDGEEESQEEDSSQSDYEFSLREENIRLKSRLEQVCANRRVRSYFHNQS